MKLELSQLRRVRWAVRAVLTLGVAASVAANVLHALPNPISQAIAAWPPLALLLAVELIARVPVHRRAVSAARLFATAAISGIAAWVSYWHMAGVASRYGETGASAYLLPVSVDGLIVVASVSLVELAARVRTVEAARPSVRPEDLLAASAWSRVPSGARPVDGRPSGLGPSAPAWPPSTPVRPVIGEPARTEPVRPTAPRTEPPRPARSESAAGGPELVRPPASRPSAGPSAPLPVRPPAPADEAARTEPARLSRTDDLEGRPSGPGGERDSTSPQVSTRPSADESAGVPADGRPRAATVDDAVRAAQGLDPLTRDGLAARLRAAGFSAANGRVSGLLGQVKAARTDQPVRPANGHPVASS